MRFPSLLIVATGMLVWSFQSNARADGHAHSEHMATTLCSTTNTWKAVYAELAVDEQRRSVDTGGRREQALLGVIWGTLALGALVDLDVQHAAPAQPPGPGREVQQNH